MIQASKGHVFHTCMKKHDFGTHKTIRVSEASKYLLTLTSRYRITKIG